MKPLKTEVAFRTPFFDIVARTMRSGQQPYYLLRLPDYVGIVAITEHGRILAVRQYRPAVDRYTVELPAGLVDPGEAPAESAARELMEETGYEASELEVLGPMLTDAGRMTNQRWTCFATGCRPMPGRQPETGIEVLSYSPAEMIEAIAGRVFDHGQDVAGIMLAIAMDRLPLRSNRSRA
jgi:ADP-ribose pyrophosphatase